MDKRYQVFISSTFTDLKEERKAIIEGLLNAKYIPAGMEMFAASNDEQFKYIKKIIDTCDYYVLIVGARYGSINPSTGKSFTEQEYDYAVEKGIPVLAFLHDDPYNLPADKRDDKNRELLEKFRNKVSDRRLCKMWHTPAELILSVIISLGEEVADNPQMGWIRGNIEDSVDLLSQIDSLHKEKERIEKEYGELKREENMGDELLIYWFEKVLGLMRDVESRFLSNCWTEFDNVSPLFVQRFKKIYPDECKKIGDCTSKILRRKKYDKNDLDLLMDAANTILSGYKNEEKKIFISHSSADKEIVQLFIDLLVHIGLKQESILCSSVPGFNVPISVDEYDYLMAEFSNKELFVVFMLSPDYYKSVACLNEMGVVWALKKQYQLILLPKFEYKDIKGTYNPKDMSIKLDDKYTRISAIGEFKDNIINFLQLDSVDSSAWDYYREQFFNEIDKI